MSKAPKKATMEEVWDTIKASEEARCRGEEALRESQLKTEKSLQQTQKEVRELNDSLKEANGNFNNKWGHFFENLLVGDLVKLLNKWNIKVDRIIQRFVLKRPDGTISAEYDLMAINGKEIVLVEVKTTLSKDDVGRFLKKLKEFKGLCREYKDKTLYGAVAYMSIKNPDYSKKFKDLSSSDMAQDKGLFLIKSPGGATDVSTIANKKGFKPTEF